MEAQLQTACETLERVACALTDIDPVHPALSGARAVLESCEWTPGGKVEAQGEDEHQIGDVWRHEHEATGEARFSPMRVVDLIQEPPPEPALIMEGGGPPWTPEELASCGWTRVRRGGQQP